MSPETVVVRDGVGVELGSLSPQQTICSLPYVSDKTKFIDVHIWV